MHPTKKFAGLVLAGGSSSRMGRDKATLDYQGQSWLSRAAELLTLAGTSQIWVNAHIESEYQQVNEPFPNLGPLSGIYAGLIATDLPLLVIPVDMPTLTIEQLHSLVNSGLQNTCVYFENSPLPCFLSNIESQKTVIKQRLTTPNSKRSLYSAWRAINGLAIASEQVLENFNTPEDINRP